MLERIYLEISLKTYDEKKYITRQLFSREFLKTYRNTF